MSGYKVTARNFCICVLLLMSAMAMAAPITETYSFRAIFTSGPVTTLNGNFTITIDPELAPSLDQECPVHTVSLVILGHTYTPSGDALCGYFPKHWGPGVVSIQTDLPVDCCAPFNFQLLFNRDTVQFLSFFYADESGNVWSTTEGAISKLRLAPSYRITNLGTLGGTRSRGYGINASGQVTGHSDTASGERHAFLYTPGTGMTDLGTLGGSESIGNGINASGQVTGEAYPRAFLYSPGTGMTDMGTLGGPWSVGFGINGSGQVTGVADRIVGRFHAFLYSPGNGMTDLGTLGGFSSWGRGINASGQVTGYADTASGRGHAFLYTPGGGMADLGTFPGGEWSQGHGINASGQIVGCAHTGNDWGDWHAFLYSPGTGMTDLGTLGGDDSCAFSINAFGQVTGVSNTRSGGSAFLFSPGKGMIDLNTLLPSGSGWEFLNGESINDAGQITGWGKINGAEHAFVLTPQNTPLGSNVTVQEGAVTVTFGEVTEAGETTVTASPTGTPPPSGFKLGNPPVYFEIHTTAEFVPPVTVCFDYANIEFGEGQLKLFHRAEGQSNWDELPTTVDEVNHRLCATVESFSEFGVFEAYDAIPPQLSLPSSVVVEATGPTGAVVTYLASALDGVDGAVPVSCAPAAGTVFALGSTTVNCAASDRSGNRAAGTFTVLVQDTTGPSLTLPSAISAWASSAAGAVVSYNASASDLVSGAVTVNCDHPSGSLFPLGATSVNCSASDGSGNTATGAFSVTVLVSWSNLLQPINVDNSSVFKLGSTVPVKFRLSGLSTPITNLVATLWAAKLTNGVTGTYLEGASTSAADAGNVFRYDTGAGQYVLNLGTKPLSAGTWSLKVDLGDGASHVVLISLRR